MVAVCGAAVEMCNPRQSYIYGVGDANGAGYLASGVLPDWLYYAFGAVTYTLELPPLTWHLGNFALPENLILGACSSAYKVLLKTLCHCFDRWKHPVLAGISYAFLVLQAVRAMLEGLRVPAEKYENFAIGADQPPEGEGQMCPMFNMTLQVSG